METLAEARTVHIVGMYKCGTSWLLHCLAAHPEILAWREFDPYVAALQRQSPRNDPMLKIKSLLCTLGGRLDLAHDHPHFNPRAKEEAFSQFFLGTGWVPLYGQENRRAAQQLRPADTTALPQLADQLFQMLGKEFQPEQAARYDAAQFHNTLGIVNFKRSSMVELMTAVLECSSSEEMPKAFYDQLTRLSNPDDVVAFKAADQIMALQKLQQDMPNTKVIAVVRDARDAMVSAWKFEALMNKIEAPWSKNSQTRHLIEFMYTWGVRAAAILKAASENKLLMIRYEDLHSNFQETIARVYRYIGVDDSLTAINDIRRTTDFETVSGGRKKGEEAESVVRKGIVGDWRNVLSPSQAALAWRVARRQMTALGYTREGVVTAPPQL